MAQTLLTLVAVAWVAIARPAGQVSASREVVMLLERMAAGTPALSAAETERLRVLLHTPEAAKDITVELALSAINRRQLNGQDTGDVTWFVFDRWRQDPRVLAFYREALQSHGPVAVADLAGLVKSPWDRSLVEPLFNVLESTRDWIVLNRGLQYMDWHYDSWANDASIPPRLTRAVLRPEFRRPNNMYNWFADLALTHDRGAIPILRPFLADKTIDQFTSTSSNMPLGVTPMRYCELAADAIGKILGEPEMVNPWMRAKVSRGGPYPEWEDWDRKIAALQRRLDAR
jgi:hypothetical protein